MWGLPLYNTTRLCQSQSRPCFIRLEQGAAAPAAELDGPPTPGGPPRGGGQTPVASAPANVAGTTIPASPAVVGATTAVVAETTMVASAPVV